MTWPLTGAVDWDTRIIQTRRATCAGVVHCARYKPGDVITAGAMVLKFDSDTLTTAQRDYIAARARRTHPEASSDDGLTPLPTPLETFGRTRRALRDHKLTRHQIERLQNPGDELQPLPILSPYAGRLLEVAAQGQQVSAGDVLFSIARTRTLCCELPPGFPAPAVGLVLQATAPDLLRPLFGTHCVVVKDGHRHLVFEFDWPERAPPAGTLMTLAPYPPDAPRAIGRPLLRGAAYVREMRRRDPSYLTPPERAERRYQEMKPVVDWKIAQTLHISRDWPISAFTPARPVRRKAVIDLDFSPEHWQLLRICTIPAAQRFVMHAHACVAQVVPLPAPEHPCEITAPQDGVFLFAHGVVNPGGILAVLQSAPGTAADFARLRRIPHNLQIPAAGAELSVWHAQPKRLVLIAQHTCWLTPAIAMGARTQTGQPLGQVRGLASDYLRTLWTATERARFGSHARVRLAHVQGARTTPETLAFLPLLDGATNNHQLELFLPAPTHWGAGWPIECVLENPQSERTVLALPVDCIVQLGRSQEVLIHTGPGQLTRCKVKLGVRYDGFVEIIDGLVDGEEVVRFLAQRMASFPLFQATMVGVYNPAFGSDAQMRLRIESFKNAPG